MYLSQTEYKNDYPALIVELKWNKSAKSAFYTDKGQEVSEMLLKIIQGQLFVGINYNKENKK